MPQSRNKGFRRFFGSRLFLLIGLAVALLFAFGFGRAYYQDYKVRQEIADLQQELENGKAKKLQLLDLYQYVNSPEFVEEKARTELNMKKPGENVLVMTNLEDNKKASELEVATPLNNPIKWWYYFIYHKLTIN